MVRHLKWWLTLLWALLRRDKPGSRALRIVQLKIYLGLLRL